ncbi:hypothetical protein [Tardiphaga sp.]|nr:hypothetical protein [Tardiphaga sp.]
MFVNCSGTQCPLARPFHARIAGAAANCGGSDTPRPEFAGIAAV